jgi:HAD superfamily hydrolase (TIGR01509 family)
MNNTVPQAQRSAARELFRAYDKGMMPLDDLLVQVSELIDLSKEQIHEAVFTGYKLDEVTLRYVGELHGRYQTAMLSNLGEATFHNIKDEIMPFFDDFVLSFSTGISKPDPRAFILAAERLRTAPAECVFIDDDPDNCQAAAATGMRAIVFQDAMSLRKELSLLLADANDQAPLGTE